jgi:MYXO-CTERM domain-containing protein
MTHERRRGSFCKLVLGLGAAGAVLGLEPRLAHAEQFTLLDETFTFTKADADNGKPNKSHYYVFQDRLGPQPSNWMAPVNYRDGIVHVHAEVLEKPAGGEVTQWILCYIPSKGIGQGYGCTGTGTYTEAGVIDIDVDMHSWWENTSIDWTQPIKEVDFVMKDANGSTGFTHLRPDPEHFFPTKMRIAMIQVSKGSSYDPSLLPGAAGGGSGGGGGGGGATASSGTPLAGGPSGGAEGASGGNAGTTSSSVAGSPSSAGSSTISGSGGGSASAGSAPTSPLAASSDSGGCTVSTPPRTAASLLSLLVLGLLFGARRQR